MARKNLNFFETKRSWSVIKDSLLECYLTPYFQKILQTKKPITYIDCCAGKGKFDDGKNGSPLIALNTRKGCLERSKNEYTYDTIDMSFIELQYAAELEQNIRAEYQGIESIHVFSGDYQKIIYSILGEKKSQNVFLYIDPYGIKTLDFELFKKLNEFNFNSLEILLNFNSFAFFRDACSVMRVSTRNDEAFFDLDDLVEYIPNADKNIPRSEKLLNKIAGGNYWRDIVLDYRDDKIDGYQAERRLSTEYKRHLRHFYKYVLDMPIKLKPNQHPKYRMIHMSNHGDGCFLMAQNMLARKDELYINIQQGGQLDLFVEERPSTEGDYITDDEIEKDTIQLASQITRPVSITRFIARFMSDYGVICEFNRIYDILDRMSSVGKVQITRSPQYTQKGDPSRFWEEKGKKKVILERK